MHEISIAISIVERVTEEADGRGGLSVKAVHLCLGMLSGVDEQALQFCYQAACDGTFLEGSELVIEMVPVTTFCPNCRTECRILPMQDLACRRCMSSTQILRGHELEVTALEVAA